MKIMKRLVSIITIIALSFATIASAATPFFVNGKTVKGNGNVVNKIIEIKDYEEFSFGGSATIYYEQKEHAAPYLRIETDENIQSLIKVTSKNGKLDITANNISPTKYVIYTNSKSLTNVDLAGSTKFTIKGKATAKSLKIKKAGSGTLTADDLKYESVLISTAGSGKVNLGGETEKVTCNSNGSGHIDMIDLKADDAKCSISGSGKIKVHAEKTVSAKIAGSGRVEYKGNPEISKSVAGSGKVVNIKHPKA